ncbi:MAG TPA: rhodanese-like domain-containing protein, partial [Chryseosolibacter sp.]
MKNVIVVLLVVAGTMEAFSQGRQETIRNVSVTEFRKAMDSLKDEVVIDLRTPDEIKGGKIAGAVEIDYFGPNFEPALKRLDKNKVYLLYCASGGRSGETAQLMDKMGFKNLYNMEGGFREWV